MLPAGEEVLKQDPVKIDFYGDKMTWGMMDDLSIWNGQEVYCIACRSARDPDPSSIESELLMDLESLWSRQALSD